MGNEVTNVTELRLRGFGKFVATSCDGVRESMSELLWKFSAVPSQVCCGVSARAVVRVLW